MEIFSPGWNLNSLNRHEISSYILSNTKLKKQTIWKDLITVNQADILPQSKQTKLEFSLHVSELKIIMHVYLP